MLFKTIKSILLLLFLVFYSNLINAQEIRVIDNKGTKVTVRNNQVSLSNISPIFPIEGDIWFDNSDTNHIITKIYDDATWRLVNTKVSLLQDEDGDTTIRVEANSDEDIIRFKTGDSNPNRQILRINNPGLFSGSNSNSAIFGLESNSSNEFDGRLRITAGNNDTFDDSQGASIDVHGNNTTANAGRIDLIAGSQASGNDLALTIWGNNGESPPTSSARLVMTGQGNIGIGNSNPNSNAILDLTNTQNFGMILPLVSDYGDVTLPTDGMVIYASSKNNAYLRGNSSWKPMAYNTVSSELIFDGDDDVSTTNDNYRYVSLVVNGNWKVIRYDKTDVNIENITTIASNSGQVTQPSTLAECSALSF